MPPLIGVSSRAKFATCVISKVRNLPVVIYQRDGFHQRLKTELASKISSPSLNELTACLLYFSHGTSTLGCMSVVSLPARYIVLLLNQHCNTTLSGTAQCEVVVVVKVMAFSSLVLRSLNLLKLDAAVIRPCREQSQSLFYQTSESSVPLRKMLLPKM